MNDIRTLLVLNQNNLDKLRARTRYCKSIIASAKFDTQKQYGPYADYWEDWLDHAGTILEDLTADLSATAQFVSELREFIMLTEAAESSAVNQRRSKEMRSLAREAIACQVDMIHMADVRIKEHREFTHKLLLVEAIDNFTDD